MQHEQIKYLNSFEEQATLSHSSRTGTSHEQSPLFHHLHCKSIQVSIHTRCILQHLQTEEIIINQQILKGEKKGAIV
jgi:hypothetical protein